MSQYSDSDLMAMLSGALSPTPTQPDRLTLDRLHATLAELSTTSVATDVAGARRSMGIAGLRGRLARRTSVVAATMVLITGGVATAAVATDTLPGPTRNLAYYLGLPVTSPGLFQAQTNLNQLKNSIDHGNRTGEVRWGRTLQHDLKGLNDIDLAQIEAPALSLLSEVGLEEPLGPPAATSTTSSTTNDGTDANQDSPKPTSSLPNSSLPNSSGGDSSDGDSSGSSPLIPTLTVPVPSNLVPTTVLSGDGSDGLQPTATTTTTISSSNADEISTGASLSLASGDLSGGN